MLFPDESYRILGACYEVHNQMGSGYLESVYQECLTIEFTKRNIPFLAQPKVKIEYSGMELQQSYQPDFVCFDNILIELKAVDHLIPRHESQLLNYLNASGLELGILINFGSHPKLEQKRIVLTKSHAKE